MWSTKILHFFGFYCQFRANIITLIIKQHQQQAHSLEHRVCTQAYFRTINLFHEKTYFLFGRLFRHLIWRPQTPRTGPEPPASIRSQNPAIHATMIETPVFIRFRHKNVLKVVKKFLGKPVYIILHPQKIDFFLLNIQGLPMQQSLSQNYLTPSQVKDTNTLAFWPAPV